MGTRCLGRRCAPPVNVVAHQPREFVRGQREGVRAFDGKPGRSHARVADAVTASPGIVRKTSTGSHGFVGAILVAGTGARGREDARDRAPTVAQDSPHHRGALRAGRPPSQAVWARSSSDPEIEPRNAGGPPTRSTAPACGPALVRGPNARAISGSMDASVAVVNEAWFSLARVVQMDIDDECTGDFEKRSRDAERSFCPETDSLAAW